MIMLEICVDSAAGLAAAVAGGAERIELCSALELGGLTPSVGLMRRAAASGCPTYAMIRPRAGDFAFGAADLATMLDDIDAAREAGLQGVVLGASLADGSLDMERLRVLLGHARGLGATLHRAFDVVPNRAAALEQAVELGFERILTSGAAETALAGAAALAASVAQAAGRLSIMAGGGVNAGNAAAVVAASGVREVHAACRGPAVHHAPAQAIGMALGALQDTRVDFVAAMARAIVSNGGEISPT